MKKHRNISIRCIIAEKEAGEAENKRVQYKALTKTVFLKIKRLKWLKKIDFNKTNNLHKTEVNVPDIKTVCFSEIALELKTKTNLSQIKNSQEVKESQLLFYISEQFLFKIYFLFTGFPSVVSSYKFILRNFVRVKRFKGFISGERVMIPEPWGARNLTGHK